jgi:hypothetical protein
LFKKFKNWKGSRKDLINNLIDIENANKSRFMMISNKTRNFIPVNVRRIQQFLDIGILPRGKLSKGDYLYNFEHIIRYLSAIILKNKGHNLNQIKNILSSHDDEDLVNTFLSNSNIKNSSKNNNLKFQLDNAEISKKLNALGREEGRVLKSQWIKFAVTKWCHLDIRQKELINLNSNEVNALSEVIIHTLNNFDKNKYKKN